MKYVRLLVLVLVVMSLVLAACGAEPTPEAITEPTQAPAPTVVVEATEKPAADAPAEKVFRYHFGSDYAGARLDPNVTFNLLAADLFAGLTLLNHDGKVVAGDGAAKSWDISDDGLTYTFHLYNDMKWSEGTPLTAHDFEFSWKRALDPATKSLRAWQIYLVEGAEAYATGEGSRDDVAVRATDDYTLEVTLKQVAPFFPDFIAVNNVFYSVPRHVVEAAGDTWTDTGTVVFSGPFLISEYVPDSLIVMEPNPGWTRQRPSIDRVEYNIIPETATALAQYQADELDFVQGIPLGEIELIQNDPALADQFTTFSESRIMCLDFNVTKPPFDNVKVRQALVAAVNQSALTQGPFRGVLDPATSLRPPGIPGEEFDSVSNLFNPERARELLAEAGYPNGEGFPEIKLQGRNQEDSRIAAEFLQGQISEILNIPVTVEILEYNAFIDLTERGEGDMYLHAIFFRAPDLYDLFGVVQNTVHNYGQWENEEWDELLASAAVEGDAAKRAEMYNEAEMTIIDNAVLVPLWITDRPSLVKPRVKGLLDDSRGIWTFTWEYIDIVE